MNNRETIVCAFCKGTGKNPHFTGTCPVCKGKGENQITGKYMACGDCRSSGQKRGTTLTCYTCAGLGVIPDTREELRRARQEIRKVREEMEQEKQELYQKPREKSKVGTRRAGKEQEYRTEDELDESRDSEGKIFCQSCGEKEKIESVFKVCEKCFHLYKFGESVEEKEKNGK